jgi:hypothetical protein
MIEKQILTQTQLVNQLLHIGHGDLSIYKDIGLKAAGHEPELLGHLIAWNAKKGEVRDSKVALPVLALRGKKDPELYENAVAHLVSLDPRNLVKAIRFHKSMPSLHDGAGKLLKRGVTEYLYYREGNSKWWDKTVLQHKASMKTLYALFHVHPSARAQNILFKGWKPRDSVFQAVALLKQMAPQEAAGTILNFNIPFTIAVGALGGVKDKPDVLLALMAKMSGNELITNTKMLQRFGVFDSPVLKAAYDEALGKARQDKRAPTLKAGRAATVVKDKKVAAKLENLQEQKLAQLGGIEGDWLVLGDKSGSMHVSIDLARRIAALIAQQVKGAVHLVFFDTSPMSYEVTGKSLTEIETLTRRIIATGSTSIGCGLQLVLDKGIVVNGIAIASDGGENTAPAFAQVYQKYAVKMGVEPPVYLFHVAGDGNTLVPNCQRASVLVEQFDINRDADYYALPNIIKTLRTSRYTLVDEIMSTPLLTFKDVFKEQTI